MLLELNEYATEVRVDFVRKSVSAIGRCAILKNLEETQDKVQRVFNLATGRATAPT